MEKKTEKKAEKETEMTTEKKTEKSPEKEMEKKGLLRTITIIAYALLIVGALIIAPVVCPPIFGYHTYTVSADYSGNVNPSGSLVYAKASDMYSAGNLVAIDNLDGDRDVDVYYVESVKDGKIALEDGSAVEMNQVIGRVVAKTPFFGYLSQLCFSVIGIIVIVIILGMGIGLATYANILARKEKK